MRIVTFGWLSIIWISCFFLQRSLQPVPQTTTITRSSKEHHILPAWYCTTVHWSPNPTTSTQSRKQVRQHPSRSSMMLPASNLRSSISMILQSNIIPALTAFPPLPPLHLPLPRSSILEPRIHHPTGPLPPQNPLSRSHFPHNRTSVVQSSPRLAFKRRQNRIDLKMSTLLEGECRRASK